MNVLLVAPKVGPLLPDVDSEIQQVVNSGLAPKVMIGTVTRRDLVTELNGDQFYDVIWFATHGSATGVTLNDGELTISALVSMIRASRAKLVFLNTCDGIYAANAISQETGADVICTLKDASSGLISDIDAFRTGALFARQLFLLRDYRRAYEQSKPGLNIAYIYLNSSKRALANGELGEIRKQIDALAAALISETAEQGQEAHSIISTTMELLEKLDQRIFAVEKRLTASEDRQTLVAGLIASDSERIAKIEDLVNPPGPIKFLRAASTAIVISALLIAIVPSWRTLLFENIFLGSIMEAALLLAALAVWHIGTLTHRQMSLDSARKRKANDAPPSEKS